MLMTDADAAPGQGLVLAELLPLCWRSVDPDTLAAEVLHRNEHNDEVLRFIAALDDYPAEIGEEHQPIAQEMARLEAKLNLLLGLMGQLLAVHFPLPPRRAVKLNPLGIEWTAEAGPGPGETGTVEVYLNSRCPRSLVFAGRIEQVSEAEGGRRFTMQFTTLNEAVQERLEKIIFRHHRRSVALARRLQSEGPAE